jgi:hypothetical protein
LVKSDVCHQCDRDGFFYKHLSDGTKQFCRLVGQQRFGWRFSGVARDPRLMLRGFSHQTGVPNVPALGTVPAELGNSKELLAGWERAAFFFAIQVFGITGNWCEDSYT